MDDTASAVVAAEWAKQDAVLLTWPHGLSDWANILNDVEPAFTAMATAISLYEHLIIICQNPAHQTHITSLLKNNNAQLEHVHYVHIPTNDTWTRDFGPISTIENNKAQLLDFEFNGWGARYPYTQDNAVNQQLQNTSIFTRPLRHCDLILEGGSIESDGQGTLLTTTHCLLNQNRNQLDKSTIEQHLKKWLFAKRILWLQHGYLAGDDTDAHIDNLARFTNPDTIIYTQCQDETDEHFTELQKMEAELNRFKTLKGDNYKLIALPLPAPIHSKTDGRRLPASYANFLIINGAVLVPQFSKKTDETALEILKACFPDRKIIGIDSQHLIEQNGGIHCLTMQLVANTVASFNKN